MNLFGKRPPPDPKKFVRESSAALRKQDRVLDRQIRNIEREEEKVKKSIKQAAKNGDKTTCGILAKEIINSRKAKSRIYTAKANIKSVELTMKQQAAMVRTTGALEKSTKVMESMQKLIKVAEVRDSMMDLQKEMMKMGIVDEMLDDTFSTLDEDEELEEATQAEIDKVLEEITAGALKPLPNSENHPLPPISVPEDEPEDEEEEEENMQRRLAALRS